MLYSADEVFTERSEQDFSRDMRIAEITEKPVRGVREKSFLNGIVRIPEEVPIDTMHQVYLGAGRTLICGILQSLLKTNLALLQERLDAIKCPIPVHGHTKCVSELKFWKARDFKYFRLHYGSFCFDGMLPQALFSSFNQLSTAIKLLNLKFVSEKNVDDAEILLSDFQNSFIELYGFHSQSYNFHALRHLCNQVRRHGPLWKTSAFGFESADHILLVSVSGTLRTVDHVTENFLLRKETMRFQMKNDESNVEKWTRVSEETERFLLRNNGPGVFHSRYIFPDTLEKMASLSYTRLNKNW